MSSSLKHVHEPLLWVLSHENKRKGVGNALEIELCRKMKSAGETRAVSQARATRVSFCLLCKIQKLVRHGPCLRHGYPVFLSVSCMVYRKWPGHGSCLRHGSPVFWVLFCLSFLLFCVFSFTCFKNVCFANCLGLAYMCFKCFRLTLCFKFKALFIKSPLCYVCIHSRVYLYTLVLRIMNKT